MAKNKKVHEITTPTREDIDRILKFRGAIWGHEKQILDVWLHEQRAKLDKQMADQVRFSSWALVIATVGLMVCTGGLIWATLLA